jgi:HB1/ASXL restriction endonuclease-like protein with HTH domain
MPDQYGFNQLGDSVALHRLPHRRPDLALARARTGATRTHPRRHAETSRCRCSAGAEPPRRTAHRQQRGEVGHNDGTTTPKSGKGEPAKQVAIDVLRQAGEPLHAKEVAKRVLASGRCAGLEGKTPEATISAMLAVGSKPGGPFARVGKGTYAGL